jgi:hypothetical protein
LGKVLVDAETFMGTVHGSMACTACHAGVAAENKEAAHEGMVVAPSNDTGAVCGTAIPLRPKSLSPACMLPKKGIGLPLIT